MENQVLVVDDEEEICLLLSGILKKSGLNVSCAYDIKSAQEVLNSSKFNIVFVDLKLPDGTGYDLFTSIKRKIIDIKIIVISAFDSEKEKSLQEGADYFISKPFTKQDVLEALEILKINVNSR